MTTMNRSTKRALWGLALCALVLALVVISQKTSLFSLVTRQVATSDAKVLSPPGADASDKERQAYFDLVTSQATAADMLVLGANCTPVPLVISLPLKKTFTIKNTDTVAHTMRLDKDHTYTIEAGKSKEIAADFGHEAGLYGYGCDSSTKAVGMMVVTP